MLLLLVNDVAAVVDVTGIVETIVDRVVGDVVVVTVVGSIVVVVADVVIVVDSVVVGLVEDVVAAVVVLVAAVVVVVDTVVVVVVGSIPISSSHVSNVLQRPRLYLGSFHILNVSFYHFSSRTTLKISMSPYSLILFIRKKEKWISIFIFWAKCRFTTAIWRILM